MISAIAGNAAITIYNQNNDITGPTNGNGAYRGFNFNLTDPNFTQDFTNPDSAPLPTSITLQSIVIREGSGTTGTFNGNVFMKIYATSDTVSTVPFSALTLIADSTNQFNLQGESAQANRTFTFDNITLDTSLNYFVVFSNVSGSATFADLDTVRLGVSNAASDTYGTGNLWNVTGDGETTFATSDSQYDAVFVINAIPEPSVALLGGLGALALLRRRRN